MKQKTLLNKNNNRNKSNQKNHSKKNKNREKIIKNNSQIKKYRLTNKKKQKIMRNKKTIFQNLICGFYNNRVKYLKVLCKINFLSMHYMMIKILQILIKPLFQGFVEALHLEKLYCLKY